MATKTGTEAPGGAGAHGGGFPPFDGGTFASQLLWLAIVFGALYWLLSKVALPRVAAILDERRGRIEGDLARAAALKADTDAAIAAYEKALADARGRAHTIAGETRDRLAADAEATRKRLEAQLSEKLAAAEKQIADTKTKAMANVQAIATEAVSAIVEKLAGIRPSPDAVAKAVARAAGGH